ncbi:MAG TPA: phosphoribosyltransferase [Bacillota bacterium]
MGESYHHYHTGITRLTWDDVMRMCRELAERVQVEYDPDIILGIAKAGVIPGAILASMLRKEFYPIRLSRRVKDRVVREKPAVLVPVPDEVEGKIVLIVDEIAATGETLRLAVGEARKRQAKKVKTATLYVHTESWRPHWYALETENLIIQPWDFEVLVRGKWVIHPEYQDEIDRIEE